VHRLSPSDLEQVSEALASGHVDWLQAALSDRLHQPYRTPLILGYETVREAAIDAGACGLVISGAGPTLLAICQRDRANTVATAMRQAWKQAEIDAEVKTLELDQNGTQVSTSISHKQT